MNDEIIMKKLSAFTDAIRQSLEAQNWTAALAVALTLPDICGRLEYPNDSSSKRYSKWFDDYMKEEYSMGHLEDATTFITGRDAYALRCSFLHGGETNISQQRIQEVLQEFIFMAPKIDNGKYFGSHCIEINGRLVLRIDEFCNDFCVATEKWAEKHCDNKSIQEKVAYMIEIYSGAISFDGVRIE
ncbi:hypothetical protein [Bacillus sp. 37MA]|uniref:hypothetical protein n=1 Tax=Bacillus sp. 37MA TaxID=1132442 RepID=UPI000362823E|nr:hypothetical protein [Bacillus sp. 37MA]